MKFGFRGLSILVGTAAVTLTASSVTALASASPTPNGAAVANPYSPAAGHSYRHGVIPTLSQHAKMKAYDTAHPSAAAATGTQTLSYGGGTDGIGVTSGDAR